jgi:hypothetical protein
MSKYENSLSFTRPDLWGFGKIGLTLQIDVILIGRLFGTLLPPMYLLCHDKRGSFGCVIPMYDMSKYENLLSFTRPDLWDFGRLDLPSKMTVI